jgi:hypothetical protein
MPRICSFPKTLTGLGIVLFLAQPLVAATPLWELRALEKQAQAQSKPPAKLQAKPQAKPQSKPQTRTPPAEAPRSTSELDRVMGKDARALVQMFGPPVQDVLEGAARKLQFASNDCILDTYLYAPAEGKEPVVSFVAARVADGRDAERNSCISALRLTR